MRKFTSVLLAAALLSTTFAAQARDGDAIIGSILGGATGAVIGNNIGGRDGAIIGGAIGAAAGVAIASDHQRNVGYNHDGYRSVHRGDDRRYDSRYDSRYDRRYQGSREVVVVESPRHYYRGNDFVYGVPEHHDNGHHRGWDRHHVRGQHGRGHSRHHYRDDRGGTVVIIQSESRRW